MTGSGEDRAAHAVHQEAVRRSASARFRRGRLAGRWAVRAA
jgi:hypothetical protein